MSLETQEKKHAILFYHELHYFSNAMGSINDAILSFFEDYSYILKGESRIFSKNSVDLLKSFYVEILSYLGKSKIAKLGSLKLIDGSYLTIIKTTLVKVVDSVYFDLVKNGIDVESRQIKIETLKNEYIVKVIESLI